jgi:peptidoglycan hydrolase-like protein with peptidoglycan-binding domain
MKRFAILGTGALLAVSLSPMAFGQPVTPLAYVQPVPPNGIQAVQDHLRRSGAYSGAVDGVWGPDSVSALQRFQASHQLQVTGQLNQATLDTLGLDPGVLLGTQQAVLGAGGAGAAAPPGVLQRRRRWRLGPEHGQRDWSVPAEPRAATDRPTHASDGDGNGAVPRFAGLPVAPFRVPRVSASRRSPPCGPGRVAPFPVPGVSASSLRAGPE